MIISDDCQFVFVHIPKCAGTSVRRALRPLDTTGEAFFPIERHPLLGPVHMAHLTLADLAEHYPATFEKLVRYRSMAIVRDPVDRFYSGLSQRLREFKLVPQSAITPSVIADEAEQVIDYLERQTGRLNLEHVHFQPQHCFIDHDGRRVVDRVFRLADIAGVAHHIRTLTGVELGEARRNRTVELRFSALRPVQRLLRDHYASWVPSDHRARIREWMTRAGIYHDAARLRHGPAGGRVERFVRDYYARDFEILAETRVAVEQAA